MKPRRYTFASDCDSELLTPEEQHFCSFNRYNRFPLRALPISPDNLSVDGSEWLQTVDAVKVNKELIRIRVITKEQRGVNVTIPCISKTLYEKYLDLRFQIRNSGKVLITFPELYIRASGYKNELYLVAHDFKVLNPNTTQPAQPKVQI